eukprot:Nk52_evm43s914 gene=Nk52_evmTU43s914
MSAGRSGAGWERDNDEDVESRMTQNDGNAGIPMGMQGQLAGAVAGNLFQAGASKAQGLFNVYGNIDILRPYFSVEPVEVRDRLRDSLVPKKFTLSVETVTSELYGPLMLAFTLCAILMFGIKIRNEEGHKVDNQGTLVGTSLGACFGYWIGSCILYWCAGFFLNVKMTFTQYLSLIGYGLFGYCLTLFTAALFHWHSSHYYIVDLISIAIGALSAARLGSVLLTRTSSFQQGAALGGGAAFLHALVLYYFYSYFT